MMIDVIGARARHRALRAEVEQDRLAAQAEGAGSGGPTSGARLRAVALAGVMVDALLLGGAAAWAKDVTCGGGPCNGTAQADAITGSAEEDDIRGRGGSDEIIGDPFDGGTAPRANDTIRGGRGRDTLHGNFTLDPQAADADVIRGGRGNDTIAVLDGDDRDRVDCGPGETDSVFFDKGDQIENCERKNPPA